MVSHFLNERYFVPYWIVQHSAHFDRVVIIDYNSSDHTRELVARLAPSSWTVKRYPRPAQFIAFENDGDVEREENQFDAAGWQKLSVTAMEHVVAPSFRAQMARLSAYHGRSSAPCYTIPTFAVAGDDPADFAAAIGATISTNNETTMTEPGSFHLLLLPWGSVDGRPCHCSATRSALCST